METYLKHYLRMQSKFGDSALYYLKRSGKLTGVTGIYVYDLFNEVDSYFQRHTESTLRTFQSKPGIYVDFYFFGAQIEPKDGPNSMTQLYYARSLNPMVKMGSFEQFRR